LTYQVLVEARVEKETRRIPHRDRKRIDQAILALASNPRHRTSKKLTEKEGYRIRVGDYRILYTIDDEERVVVIYRIKIRSEKTYR